MDRRTVHYRAERRRATALAFAVALFAGVVTAEPLLAQQKLAPTATRWKPSEDFGKSNDARINLSGAACATTAPPLLSCIIVNDEKKYAQFFKIEGTSLEPKKVIRLLDEDAKGDPDAEGAAYDDGYFYITGSHGRSRNNPKKKTDSSYQVFRFAVDKSSGKPAFEVSDDEVIGIDSSSRLRDVLENAEQIDRIGEPVSDRFDKRLDKNGVNIEGIAAKDGRLYFGLRGPSDDQQAFVISVDAGALFTKRRPLDARIAALKLGTDTGIRDLAAVKDGLLVLSGPVNDQQVTPAVFLWQERSGALKKIGELDIPTSLAQHKAETLLVLDDAEGEPWRALVMFDGPVNGAPTEYRLPR